MPQRYQFSFLVPPCLNPGHEGPTRKALRLRVKITGGLAVISTIAVCIPHHLFALLAPPGNNASILLWGKVKQVTIVVEMSQFEGI